MKNNDDYLNVSTGKMITPDYVKKMVNVNHKYKIVANKDDKILFQNTIEKFDIDSIDINKIHTIIRLNSKSGYYDLSSENFISSSIARKMKYINHKYGIVTNESHIFKYVVNSLNQKEILFNNIRETVASKDDNYYNISSGKVISSGFIKKMTNINEKYKLVANKDDLRSLEHIIYLLDHTKDITIPSENIEESIQDILKNGSEFYYNVSSHKLLSSNVIKKMTNINEKYKVVANKDDKELFSYVIFVLTRLEGDDICTNSVLTDKNESEVKYKEIISKIKNNQTKNYYNVSSDEFIKSPDKMDHINHKYGIVANKEDGTFKRIVELLDIELIDIKEVHKIVRARKGYYNVSTQQFVPLNDIKDIANVNHKYGIVTDDLHIFNHVITLLDEKEHIFELIRKATPSNEKYYHVDDKCLVVPKMGHKNEKYKLICNDLDTLDYIVHLLDNTNILKIPQKDIEMSIKEIGNHDRKNYYNVTTGKEIGSMTLKKMTNVNEKYKIVANKDDKELFDYVLFILNRLHFNENIQQIIGENIQQIKEGNNQQIKEGNIQQIKEGNIQQSKEENNQQIKEGNNQQIKRENIQQINGGNNQQINGGNNQQINGGNNQQINGGNNQQINGGNGQQIKKENIQQINGENGQQIKARNTQQIGINVPTITETPNLMKIIENRDKEIISKSIQIKKESKRSSKEGKKSRSIPAPIRQMVWRQYIGNNMDGKCWCCDRNISYETWHAGHVLADSEGGLISVDNLRPICVSCNLSMGNKHMAEFIIEYNFKGKGSQEFNKK